VPTSVVENRDLLLIFLFISFTSLDEDSGAFLHSNNEKVPLAKQA
jgi:hypothetical protein